MTNKRNKVSVSIISGVTVGLLLLTMGKGSASMVLPSQKDIDVGTSTITQQVKKRVWDLGDKKDEQESVESTTITEPKEVLNYEDFSGEYTPTVDLNIREEPWGNIQSTLTPGVTLTASRKVISDGVTWIEVAYTYNDSNYIGWASANYIQTMEEANQQAALEEQARLQAEEQALIYQEQSTQPTSSSLTQDVTSTETTNQTVSQPETQVVTESVPTQPQYSPNHIYFNGTSRPYQNGGYDQGQSIIDGTSSASTWGGTQVFSGYDGLSTHFIGHSHTQFAGLTGASTYIITDSEGNAFQYQKTATYLVDEQGYDVNSGEDLYDLITGTGGGERVIMQTTQVHPLKWIYVGDFVGQVN